jgi:hypothetical protein
LTISLRGLLRTSGKEYVSLVPLTNRVPVSISYAVHLTRSFILGTHIQPGVWCQFAILRVAPHRAGTGMHMTRSPYKGWVQMTRVSGFPHQCPYTTHTQAMGGTVCTEPPRLAPTTPTRPPAHTASTRIPPMIITPDP